MRVYGFDNSYWGTSFGHLWLVVPESGDGFFVHDGTWERHMTYGPGVNHCRSTENLVARGSVAPADVTDAILERYMPAWLRLPEGL